MLFRIANHRIKVNAQLLMEGEDAICDYTPEGIEYHRYLEIICPCGCEQVAGIFKQGNSDDPFTELTVWVEAYETRGWG